MQGDKLASGQHSAQFPASSSKVTQEQWDERVGKKPAKKASATNSDPRGWFNAASFGDEE